MKKNIYVGLLLSIFCFVGFSNVAKAESTYTEYTFLENGDNYSVIVDDDYKDLLSEASIIVDGETHELDIENAISETPTNSPNDTPRTRSNIPNGVWLQQRYWVAANTYTYSTARSTTVATMLLRIQQVSDSRVIIQAKSTGKIVQLSGVRIFTGGPHYFRVQNQSSSTKDISLSVSF